MSTYHINNALDGSDKNNNAITWARNKRKQR